jgi:hypothetical protein
MTDTANAHGGPYFYRLICEKCGDVRRTSESNTFFDPIFHPSRCPACGHRKHKTARAYEDSGWIEQYGRYVRDEPFRLLSPSTWFSSKWVDYVEVSDD